MASNNSISAAIQQMLKLYNNLLEFFVKFRRVFTGNEEIVDITVRDDANNETTYEVPSLGYMRNQINRLDENVKTLAGLEDSDVTIRMADGSYKKIYNAQFRKDPPRISSVATPGKFQRRSNYFFENFLNPLLYIKFDVASQVDLDTKRAVVKRLVLNLDSEDKKRIFNERLKGHNDLEYEDLMVFLVQAGINFFLDEEIVDLPVGIVRYSGLFSVMGITDDADAGTRKFRVDKITYTDNLDTIKNSRTLKVGDVLLRGEVTKYEITEIDATSRQIVVKRLSGHEPITIGVDVLSLYSEVYSSKEIQVGIGYDEYQVVFLKAIDPKFEIASTRWSPGTAFYSNDLVIDTPTGSMTLADYYKTEVLDVGAPLRALARERIVGASDGLKPAAPRLEADNFKVVRINDHKLNSPDLQKVRDAGRQKVQYTSQIERLNEIIKEKQEKLYNSKFATEAERASVESELDGAIKKRDSLSKALSTLIQELGSIAQNSSSLLDKPKFRIRGFWPFPAPRVTTEGTQEVIQFIVAYRYLRTDGNATATEAIKYVDNNGQELRGYFSNWNEYRTDIRKREYSLVDGRYVWSDENAEDAEAVNVNQLDIAISPGEKVEMRLMSVSEAGWPYNPMTSDWSNSVTIGFPEELVPTDDSEIIMKDIVKDENRTAVTDEFTARNIDLHLKSQRTVKDRFYAHDAGDISSGFFGVDGGVLSLLDKMRSLEDDIATLKSQIQKTKGKLVVKLIDHEGNKHTLSNGTTLDIFAGYYSEIVSQMPISERKGAIISRVFYLTIENGDATPLELISKFPGGFANDLPNTSTNIWNGVTYQDPDYYLSRKYDLAPVVYNGVNSSTELWPKVTKPAYQSSQLLSQFLYMRYTDIGLNTPLFSSPNAVTPAGATVPERFLAPDLPVPGNIPFVWNGKYDGTTKKPLGNGSLTTFCLHTDHPLLSGSTLKTMQLPAPLNGVPSVSPIRHSYFFQFDANHPSGKLQLEYQEPNEWDNAALYPAELNQYPDKLGFVSEDRYLIGSDTCGSYLFLAPPFLDTMRVDGTDHRAHTMLPVGEQYAIKIPIIFQFRMADYYGLGGEDGGIVSGWNPNGIVNANPTYTKRIGLDFNTRDEGVVSVDIQVTGRYMQESLGQAALPPGVPAYIRSREVLPYINTGG
jgi:hypothetical protein